MTRLYSYNILGQMQASFEDTTLKGDKCGSGGMTLSVRRLSQVTIILETLCCGILYIIYIITILWVARPLNSKRYDDVLRSITRWIDTIPNPNEQSTSVDP